MAHFSHCSCRMFVTGFVVGVVSLLAATCSAQNCRTPATQAKTAAKKDPQAGTKLVFSKPLESQTPFYGSALTEDDLKYKVVYVHNWGINCPLCKVAAPKLIGLNAKLAQTGLFQVVGNHCQGFNESVTAYCQKTQTNFPVYQFLSTQVKGNGGIPFGELYDAKGSLVASGTPKQLLADQRRLAALIQQAAALAKYAGHPLENFEFKHLESFKNRFSSRGAWMPVLTSLAKIKASDKDAEKQAEAAAILTTIKTYLDGEVVEFAALAQSDPFKAYSKGKQLAVRVKGLPHEALIAKTLTPLSEVKNLRSMGLVVEGWRKSKKNLELGKITEKSYQLGTRSAKAKLEKYAQDVPTGSAVATALQKVLQEMGG